MSEYNLLEANKMLINSGAYLARDMDFSPERKPMGIMAQRKLESRVERWRESAMKIVQQHQSAHKEIQSLKSRIEALEAVPLPKDVSEMLMQLRLQRAEEDEAAAMIEQLARKIEALENPCIQIWFPVYGGVIDKECGIAMLINQVHEATLDGVMEGMPEEIEAMDIDDTPDNAYGVTIKVSNFVYNEGQQSFPETGQWDFMPYWEVDSEFISWDIPTPPKGAE